MIDLLLVMTVGFLGSFGHCVGMCGPLTVAFSLSGKSETQPSWQQQFYFHFLLNFGRIISYALVGAAIGALGSAVIASGQLAGIGSVLRRLIAIFTGILLVWFGLVQIKPEWLPRLPVFHPLAEGNWHNRLQKAMLNLSMQNSCWTPALLGLVWGLIPCGFLYAAQIKAAETGNLWMGAATMLAFGLGTMPSMLGVGVSASRLSASRRSQLFKLGGWVTLTIGILTLLRTDEMVDYTGHGALLCLLLALIARPLSRLWPALLHYRRALGVGAFVLSVAHTFHMMDHTLNWNFDALSFMLQQHQVGMWAGILALVLMIPLALTSFDRAMSYLGTRWRLLHLLSVPAFVLCAGHAVLLGSHYLGALEWTWGSKLNAALLGAITLAVLLVRLRLFWSILFLERFYAPPSQR
ncbi:sulfite exporter TauE/SafE family protein [Microcoleus sp. FACHB-68]|uniref:urease accessory protein UreH domain-containing protein n=1 Tax=Microcoleus sp. FACHB-68 TaxID=2692826 RepID=UPI001682476C|nr:sulfite exporter TauE/SafE family protein [Microcoleus sp. FACHB-68]MBD1938275.1 sulfite exporter TauE/SafE family protein [Microcoleus sp. FACHB-68]